MKTFALGTPEMDMSDPVLTFSQCAVKGPIYAD